MKIEKDPIKSVVYGETNDLAISKEEMESHPFGIREKLVLLTLVAGIVILVYGTKTFGWYFTELSALFMIMGLISAVIMGWGPNEIANKLSKSIEGIAVCCVMIGLARGVLIVLQHGNIIDTIVYGISLPLTHMPKLLAAEFMLLAQTVLNFLIPSGSGQAVVSMPIMAPVADLVGVSRQISVLCFQFGDGISNLLWPTGMVPIVAGIANVKVEKWWKWFIPLFFMILATQMVCIGIAVMIGWS